MKFKRENPIQPSSREKEENPRSTSESKVPLFRGHAYLHQDSQDFLPGESNVSLSLPSSSTKESHETTSQSKNSWPLSKQRQLHRNLGRPLSPRGGSGFMARARPTMGTRANIPSSLSRLRALAHTFLASVQRFSRKSWSAAVFARPTCLSPRICFVI